VPGPATEYFGSSVAVTDINRDGYADIATGSPDASPAGNVIVLYGSKNGLVTKGAQLFTQNTKGVPGRNEDGDDFGARVTFADISGDRRLDLIVGSPGEDRNHGRIYILPNAKGRITGKGSLSYDRKPFGITAPRSSFGWFFG
jgi:hypothetical protein